ncbi:restriction endonuclease [Mucilaginibacter sp.]|uniref:restriction endonuclease n=1 Tax=Mucilaginibacter sp. TaxID=1882438 RepID=UPI0026040780|nr:restriction endonuclease [Mucilaginibacter sp.]MDB4918484.1 hypothetical protein [Mucilaginibacter sp.]
MSSSLNKKLFTFTSIVDETYVEQMTPKQFELTVHDYMEEIGNGLPDFKITHNAQLVGSDGIYQIDVLASYTALGVKMVVLIECKHYTKAVSREKVQLLYDKLRSTGAHKGILFSTAGFQDGAIEYALRHKIALVRMLTDRFENITNSLEKPKKRDFFILPKPPKFIAECYCDEQLNYIKLGKIGGLVKYLTGEISENN